jgi:diaminopimelate decarboxylase
MPLWWERNDLAYDSHGELFFAGERVSALAENCGTPAFFYSRARAFAKIKAIRAALGEAGLRHRLFYAMKANRFMPLLSTFAERRLCGVDVCSPGEITHALACGFREEDISFTGTSVSEADLDSICRHPNILLNCDSQSMLRRAAKRNAFRRVGLRINPAIGVGYGNNQLLAYSGDATSKFGIYAEQFDETIKLAAALGLEIVRIHFHTGCGYLNTQLSVFDKILETCAAFIRKLPRLEAINIGGGLGVRL